MQILSIFSEWLTCPNKTGTLTLDRGAGCQIGCIFHRCGGRLCWPSLEDDLCGFRGNGVRVAGERVSRSRCFRDHHRWRGWIDSEGSDRFNGARAMIRRIYEDAEFRATMCKKAAETTQQYTCERNGEELLKIFQEALRRKAGQAAQPVAQEL